MKIEKKQVKPKKIGGAAVSAYRQPPTSTPTLFCRQGDAKGDFSLGRRGREH